MGTLRCASRSIVLKNALRILSRCTLAAGQKQKPQKVESKALHDQQNGGGENIALFMGVLFALHQKPNKTKARTNADIKTRSASCLTSNTQGAADPIQNARRRSSFIFRRIQSTKAAYFKAVTNSKYSIVKLHKTAQ